MTICVQRWRGASKTRRRKTRDDLLLVSPPPVSPSPVPVSRRELGLRLAVGLGLFWHVRGYSREGLAWLEAALARHPDAAAALRARAGSRTVRATLCRLYGESLTLAQELGFQIYIAQSLNSLEEVARLEQDDAQAEIHYCHSLQLARELGVRELVRVELHNLGHVALHQHQVAQAAAHFAEALRLGQALEHEINIGHALAGLGAVALTRERPQLAANPHRPHPRT